MVVGNGLDRIALSAGEVRRFIARLVFDVAVLLSVLLAVPVTLLFVLLLDMVRLVCELVIGSGEGKAVVPFVA